MKKDTLYDYEILVKNTKLPENFIRQYFNYLTLADEKDIVDERYANCEKCPNAKVSIVSFDVFVNCRLLFVGISRIQHYISAD